MIATARPKERTARFPEEELTATLTKWWAAEALERVDDPFSPVLQTVGTIYELLPALDSLTIVRSFLIIEEIMEMPVPVCLVKPGGYQSREEMLGDLVPKLRKYY
jgi:hypothetical protein